MLHKLNSIRIHGERRISAHFWLSNAGKNKIKMKGAAYILYIYKDTLQTIMCPLIALHTDRKCLVGKSMNFVHYMCCILETTLPKVIEF